MLLETIENTLNKKVVDEKQTFKSDYKAPIITGVVAAIIFEALDLVLKLIR